VGELSRCSQDATPSPGFEPKNGEKIARITARKLVWEIPEVKKVG